MASAWQKKSYFRLGLAYLAAVLVHGLWNGLLILAGILTNTWWLTVLGLVPLATGATGFCPAYLPLRISTSKRE